jgi:hypothetical protein
MKTFAVTGRCIAAPPPAEWCEKLAQMLGSKPRRIGTWAELGLYGALSCMADAGETRLPQDAQIWLGSRRGTWAATGVALAQMQEDLPMPLTFLQTQPSQTLALLAAQLDWNGHACFVAGPDPLALIRLAGAQAGNGGLLLGWLDEMAGGETCWLRLRPGPVARDFADSPPAALFSAQTSHVVMTATGVELKQAAVRL